MDWLLINSARLTLVGPALTLLLFLLFRRRLQPKLWILACAVLAVLLVFLYARKESFPLL